MRASTHAPTTLKGCPNRSWRTWRAFVRTPGTDSYLWTPNSAEPSRKCIRRAIFVGSSKAFESTIRKKMLVRILLDVPFRVFRFPWQFCNTTVIICVAFRGDMRFFFFSRDARIPESKKYLIYFSKPAKMRVVSSMGQTTIKRSICFVVSSSAYFAGASPVSYLPKKSEPVLFRYIKI